MIGVDTNVLARLLVNDDAGQSAKARRFFAERSESDPAHVTIVVIAELSWLLEKRMKYTRAQTLGAIEQLLGLVDVVIEQREVVAWALQHGRGPRVDFTDALVAEANRRAGSARTVTFDIDAATRIPGMELLR